MNNDIKELLKAPLQGQDLTLDQSKQLFSALVAGQLSAIQISALVIALKLKGETPQEIAGAATALRLNARSFNTDIVEMCDTCGTGGDGAATVNISTAVAFVVAQCGLAVAKHGNRSVSSSCGSADLLEQCGVRLDASPEIARLCLEQAGICFLFAPHYHAGIRHAMPVRKALGVRTIFNLLGPLLNPAQPPIQLMGVYDPKLCHTLAETLNLLGCRSALVVHGGGLDEMALHAPTTVARLHQGKVETLSIDCVEGGLKPAKLSALSGGTPEQNKVWLLQILKGHGNATHNDAIALNAGALLWVADLVSDLRQGVEQAQQALLSGKCYERLSQLATLSHSS